MDKQDVIEILDELTNRLAGPVETAWEGAVRFYLMTSLIGVALAVACLAGAVAAWRYWMRRHREEKAELRAEIEAWEEKKAARKATERAYFSPSRPSRRDSGFDIGAWVIAGSLAFIGVLILVFALPGAVAPEWTAIKAFLPW